MLNDGTTNNPLQYQYDAAGRMTKISYPGFTIPKRTDDYDGDGQRVRSGYAGCYPEYTCPLQHTYYLRSSVLGGQIISELQSNGQRLTSYVYDARGKLLALQKVPTGSNVSGFILWEHWDASGMSQRATNIAGDTTSYDGNRYNAELDPVGADAGLEDPYANQELETTLPDEYSPGWLINGDPTNLSGGCRLDGMPIPCSELASRMDTGSVAQEFLFHGSGGFERLHLPVFSYGLGLVLGVDPGSLRVTEGGLRGELRLLQLSHGQDNQVKPHGPFGGTPVADELLDEYEKGLKGFLNGKFIERVLQEIQGIPNIIGDKAEAFSTDVLELFKEVRRQDGFVIESQAFDGGGRAFHHIGSKRAKIGLKLLTANAGGTNFNDFYRTIVHELIHAAPKTGTWMFTHAQMAQAGFKAAQALNIPVYAGAPPLPGSSEDTNSQYFENILLKACGVK